MSSSFLCGKCGKTFMLPPATRAKYPGWNPKTCRSCKANSFAKEEELTREEVLEKYTAGPVSGIFTDGSADPNPGPGGWGAVYVENNVILAEESGHDPHTTNNRMELEGLLAALRMAPAGIPLTIYSDSELCVKTFTQWAAAWKAQGWTRGKKKEAIKNLDLVERVYEEFCRRKELKLVWIKAHAGNRWNEYADALATSYRKR